MRPIACLVAVASLCVGAGGAHAQSVFFLRLAPEVGRITVEHTKKVTVQRESSSSMSSSSGLALAANLSAGLRLKLPKTGSWAASLRASSLAAASSRARFPRPRTETFTTSGRASGTSATWPGWAATSSSGAGSETASHRSTSSAGGVACRPSSLPDGRILRPESPAKTARVSEDGRGRSARE